MHLLRRPLPLVSLEASVVACPLQTVVPHSLPQKPPDDPLTRLHRQMISVKDYLHALAPVWYV